MKIWFPNFSTFVNLESLGSSREVIAIYNCNSKCKKRRDVKYLWYNAIVERNPIATFIEAINMQILV